MSSFRSSEPTGVRINTRTGPASETPVESPVWWLAAAYLAIALLADTEVLPLFPVHGAQISAVLVVVVWYALHSDMRGAIVFGLVAGACEDALGTQTGFGWTISTTITAFLVNYLTRWFFADSVAVIAGVVVFATLMRRMLFWTAMALQPIFGNQGYPAGYARLHLHEALWEAALNALLALAGILAVNRYVERRAQ